MRVSPGLSVGARIRGFREAQGLTLKALSEQSGVSIATISKIENGKVSGGFETIYKIARGLGVLVTEVIADSQIQQQPIAIERADPDHVHPTSFYDYYPQANRREGELNSYVIVVHTHEIPPRRDWSIHEGEEIVLVQSGRMVLHVEGEAPVELREGDSACFDCGRRHCFVSAGLAAARIVSVSTRRPMRLLTRGLHSGDDFQN